MVMVCSSTGMEAMISRAGWDTLIVMGWSAVAWEGAQLVMVESSEEMMSGEMYFSVQVETARLSWREVLSRHQVLVMEGRWRRQR